MGDYLTVKEKHYYETIKQVVNGKKTKQRAEVELALSRRQINRLIQRYLSKGRRGFQHGNCGRSPSTKISPSLRKQIVSIYQTKYASFNFKHFHEFLVKEEGFCLSESSVRNILSQAHILAPKARRSTKRRWKKQLLNKQNKSTLTQRELSLLKEVQLVEGKKAHPSRSRKKYAGELIQMDASQHVWFGTEKAFLHVAIDDASGEIVGAFFDKQETLAAYYEVSAQFLENKGIPVEILTDNRTIFKAGRKEKGSLSDQRTLTQYGYMCQNLGIVLSTTSIPQAKGRVERVFNTLQDRLISEMRLANIQTLAEANHFLIQFIPLFNQRFAFQLKDNRNVFQKIDP
ncbi:ISNCY family transposase, partial [Facklamia sp. P13055]